MIILTIGRKTDCNIVLTAETVSRLHAELHVIGGGRFIIQDNDSTSGTFMKDGSSWRRIRRATISTTDILKFGDLQIGLGELLTKAGPLAQATDIVEARSAPAAGSRYERDPDTGKIRERR